MNKYVGAALAIFAAAVLPAAQAPAQNFPDHPVKIIVPYPAGGPADTVARVSTQGLGAELGGNVIIENVAGAGGRIGTKDVTRATPDGYTLLLGSSNEYAITPALYQKLDFDPVKELVPVAPLLTDTIAIVVHPSVPVNSLKELAAYANAHPGKLTMGSTLGIAPHLALMYFEKHMHADIVFVPYKGAAPGLADAMGNQIQVTSSAKSVLVPLIKAGRLKALAVSSSARWPELPEVPTFAESGLDGFPATILFGLLAPAGTPPGVIAKINAAENARLKSEATQAGIAKLGMYPNIETAAAFAKQLTDDAVLWRAVVKESGVHLD